MKITLRQVLLLAFLAACICYAYMLFHDRDSTGRLLDYLAAHAELEWNITRDNELHITLKLYDKNDDNHYLALANLINKSSIKHVFVTFRDPLYDNHKNVITKMNSVYIKGNAKSTISAAKFINRDTASIHISNCSVKLDVVAECDSLHRVKISDSFIVSSEDRQLFGGCSHFSYINCKGVKNHLKYLTGTNTIIELLNLYETEIDVNDLMNINKAQIGKLVLTFDHTTINLLTNILHSKTRYEDIMVNDIDDDHEKEVWSLVDKIRALAN